MTRLLLVRHAPTEATRRGAFATDEPIIDSERARGAALLRHLLPADAVLSSPALRCRQTAAAVGLEPELAFELAECDFGAWEGRTFGEVAAAEPELTGGWLRDPDAAPHGGESLRRFAARVGGWLVGAADAPEAQTVAFTHAGVIKAAVVNALGAPLDAFWRITAAPLSLTELRAHDGVWTLVRSNWTEPR